MFKRLMIVVVLVTTVLIAAPAKSDWYVHVQAADGWYGWMISETFDDAKEWAFKRCREASSVPDTCVVTDSEERE